LKVHGKLAPRFIGPFKITKEREEEFKAEFLNFFSDPGTRFILRGVGLSHSKIPNFGMLLKIH
jgi:hypothetical protein